MDAKTTDLAPRPDGAGPQRRAQRLATPRMQRELETIRAMMRIACRDRHGSGDSLCPACAELMDYATRRLAACPYGPDKPTCSNCKIHCYGPREREQVRDVMRYAGPRMLREHPVLAIRHIVDGRRTAPPKPRNPNAQSDTAT